MAVVLRAGGRAARSQRGVVGDGDDAGRRTVRTCDAAAEGQIGAVDSRISGAGAIDLKRGRSRPERDALPIVDDCGSVDAAQARSKVVAGAGVVAGEESV